MQVEFTKAGSSTRQAFYDSWLTFWARRWDANFLQEFLDWRYARRVDGETLLAMSGEKCIGFIDTFIRPYRFGGQQIIVREPCDWYCLPEFGGTDLRFMDFLIAQGQPLLGVGLPESAIAIASRLRWRHLLDTHDFILPITVRRVAGAVIRKAKLGNGSLAAYLPHELNLRSRHTWTKYDEAEGVVSEISPDDWPREQDFLEANQADIYAIAPVPTRTYVKWLASGPPTLGEVLCLEFRRKGVRIGLTILRIEESKVGCKARIIHLHANELKLSTLQWMIAANIGRATQLKVESVHCRSSCSTTSAALSSLHFHPTANEAVMVGFNDQQLPIGPVNISFLHGDDAMVPSRIAE